MKTTHRQRPETAYGSPAKEEPNKWISLASIEMKPPMRHECARSEAGIQQEERCLPEEAESSTRLHTSET